MPGNRAGDKKKQNSFPANEDQAKSGLACNPSTPLHQGNGDKLERSLQNYISCHGSPIGAATHEKCHWGPGIVTLDSASGLFTALE